MSGIATTVSSFSRAELESTRRVIKYGSTNKSYQIRLISHNI